jgi:hypothetical protein
MFLTKAVHKKMERKVEGEFKVSLQNKDNKKKMRFEVLSFGSLGQIDDGISDASRSGNFCNLKTFRTSKIRHWKAYC